MSSLDLPPKRVESVAHQHGATYARIDGEMIPVADPRAHGALASDMLRKLIMSYSQSSDAQLLEDAALERAMGYSLTKTDCDPLILAQTLEDIGQLRASVQATCAQCGQVQGVYAADQVHGLYLACGYCRSDEMMYANGYTLTQGPPLGERTLKPMQQLGESTVKRIILAQLTEDDKLYAAQGSNARFWQLALDKGLIDQAYYDRLSSHERSSWAGD